MRPLDQVRVRAERLNWQLFNIVLPVLMVVSFGVLRFVWRKRKYSRFQSQKTEKE